MSYVRQILSAREQALEQGFNQITPKGPSLMDAFSDHKVQQFIMVVFCSLMFTVIIVSFRPFDAAQSASSFDDGDPVNQIGFVALLGIIFLGLLTGVSKRKLRYFLSPSLFLFMAALAISLTIHPEPGEAMRGLALSLIAAFVVFGILLLAQDQQTLRHILIATSILVLLISYAGLFVFPNEAKHISLSHEAQHYGLWRGPFSHKNVAGPVFCVLTIFGVYIFRSGHLWLGIAIALSSFIFVLNTGSKTTSGFLPIAIGIVLFARLFSSKSMVIILALMSIIAVATLTLGSIYYESIEAITALFLDDTTFTGRKSLWLFGIDHILQRPFLGYGFNNFWGTAAIENAPLPSYAAWDVRNMVYAHNNYIDLLISFGTFGGVFVALLVFILPFRNYVCAYTHQGNQKLADMFIMIVILMMLVSFMETFILWRSDPNWILHIFAVFGLHFLAAKARDKTGLW